MSGKVKQKRILYIEGNTDGTIGGSYYSLLGLLKCLDRNKFAPLTIFYVEHSIVSEYEKICPVIIFSKSVGLKVRKDFPKLYNVTKILHVSFLLTFYQKVFNFISCYLPDLAKSISVLRKKNINIVHINNAPIYSDWLIACKLLRIKCVSHFRGIIKLGYFKRKSIRFYDAVVSISNAVTENAKSQGINVRNFRLIYNGIDIEAFLKRKKRDNISIKNEFQKEIEKPLIGITSNIKEWKGQHVLIKAVKILREKNIDITCLIVGDVSNLPLDRHYYQYLKKLVKDNDLFQNIIFTGFREDIPDIISALDILVHTSIAPEPFGRIILEGMALSKPVIATALGGPLEIIEEGISGFLVPPNNSEVLAQKIEYLISNTSVAEQVGIKAKKRVEKYFTFEKNAKLTEQLYCDL